MMHLRDRDGFTLIELLIVILIIGILAAIGIPSFLGQREKARARALEVSARGMEKEMLAIAGDYGRDYPLILSTSSSQQGCFESINKRSESSCSTIYPDIPNAGTYSDLSDIITIYVNHQNRGLVAVSPYDGTPLVTMDDSLASKSGHVLITNTSNNQLLISSWTPSGVFLTNTPISAR